MQSVLSNVVSRRRARVLAGLFFSCCALALPSVASAADIVVNDDTTGPGPAGANCTSLAPFASIQAAATAANPGDRILVCAGTYNEQQVDVTKRLDIIGAGPGQTIIDGGTAQNLPNGGLVRIAQSTDGDVLLSGFTTRNPGQTGTGASTPRFHFTIKGDDPGTTNEIENVEVDGGGAAYRDYGLYADGDSNDLIVHDSSITGTDFNPILLERHTGAATIRDNTISPDGTTNTSSVFVFTYQANPVTQPQRIVRNDIDANGRSGITVSGGFQALAANGFDSVEIRDNDISDFGTNGLSITNVDPVAGGVAGEISNVSVEHNTFAERDGSAASRAVRVLGRVRNVDIRSNTIVGLVRGLTFDPNSGAGAQDVTVRFNRIAGNTTAGLASTITEEIDAEHNWWGCNEGPNQTGCDAVTGTVDFDPWLVLTLTASPSSISTDGDTSDLTADFTIDSSGDDAGDGIPEGTPVIFGTDLGTVSSPAETADGVATSTLTSQDDEGTANVTASLDGETATDTVQIVSPVEPAALSLSVDPKKRKVTAGESATYEATVTNTGETDADNVVVCARVRQIKDCVTIGQVADGAIVNQDLTIKTKKNMKTKAYKAHFKVTSDNAPTEKTQGTLKVRPA